MSKKEEILHKLSTEDRNYIKKKFKEREEFCIGQVESLTNLINVLIEENRDLNDEIFKLEHRLANCIEPKFKVGQEVWCIWGKSVGSFIVTRIDIDINNCVLIGYGNRYLHQFEENCFATKEEAKAKLEELKNDKKEI